jgi:carbonyl reductase 1
MAAAAIAVVTGANRGIGLQVSRQLAQRGVRVIVTARAIEKAQRAADGLRAIGFDVTPAVLDVSDDASAAAFADELRRTLPPGGKIGALVNNAAIAMKGFDGNVARKTIDTNFYGVMRVTDALAPLLGESARVVNVSSGMGDLSVLGDPLRPRFADPMPRTEIVGLMERFVRAVEEGVYAREGWPASAYSVSKVGVNALTRALARELAPRKILVDSVCPGWVKTDMGGAHAPRSVEEGADTIVWTATGGAKSATGKIFRDRREATW